jgi:hypothetical protein
LCRYSEANRSSAGYGGGSAGYGGRGGSEGGSGGGGGNNNSNSSWGADDEDIFLPYTDFYNDAVNCGGAVQVEFRFS